MDSTTEEGQMAQRVSLFHPTIKDPRTGGALEAIGVVGGRVVWPVIGGADDDGSTNDGNAGDNNDAGQNDQGGEGQQNNEGQTGDSTNDDEGQKSETVSKADFDALFSRMQAADRRASNAENELKKLQDVGKTEQQRKEDEAAAALKEAETLREQIKHARIGNAFLTVKGFNWHDPSDALDMLMARYLDGVEADDDGKVTGIEAAVKKMAKDKSYLIKTEAGSTAGDQMNGKRKGEGNSADQKAKDAELVKRFPALQRGVRS
jgi:hypothetical protein